MPGRVKDDLVSYGGSSWTWRSRTCGTLKRSVHPTATTALIALEADAVLRLLPHGLCRPHGPAYSVDRTQTPA